MTKQTLNLKQALFDGVSFAYTVLAVTFLVFPLGDDAVDWVPRLALIFAGLTGLGFVLALVFDRLSIRTLGWHIYASEKAKSDPRYAVEHAVWYRTFWGAQLAVLSAVTVLTGLIVTEIDLLKLLEADRFYHTMNLFGQLFSPDWTLLPKAILKVIETIYIAFMATAIAVPIAFVLSFLMARNLMRVSRWTMVVYTVLRTVFNVSRSIEPVLWAIIFSIWASFGPFAGMLALLVHSVASLAKQYSEIVEGVEDGPIEGIESTGASRLQVVWFAVVPQVVLPYISYTVYRWDTNVRMATILGLVGGGGIGTMLMEYFGQAMWPQVGCLIVVIASVVWIMDALSSHVRAALK